MYCEIVVLRWRTMPLFVRDAALPLPRLHRPLARSSPTKANSNPITPHTISTPMASSPIHSRRIAPAQAFMCSPSSSPLLA